MKITSLLIVEKEYNNEYKYLIYMLKYPYTSTYTNKHTHISFFSKASLSKEVYIYIYISEKYTCLLKAHS